MAHHFSNGTLPRHIVIIMDGNGRWAKKRGLPRVVGHRAGIKAVRDTVEACAELSIGYLTLFAFSVENWKRPKSEVETLMNLLQEYLDKELPTLMKNNIRFGAIGRLGDLSPEVQARLESVVEKTSKNTGLQFFLALNYSGRAEIIDAVNAAISTNQSHALTEDEFRSFLYAPHVPDPDLMIRTSGELRISNFLLWQLAYTEIYVTKVLWPDFRRRHLQQALEAFSTRERRFGGIDNEA
ncbi:MAG TPA: isoprenyl transferase [Thermoanaerobaculia bacterium]|nr:isoprenyl transferase [Thermoanaerobaculia bacterium]HUM30183.1 isoprenyl transferase [Thermoanaerobaculia bacterium]HXK68368.1 isoprenyl transferase [Thermoanaerobaculia bacterium]